MPDPNDKSSDPLPPTGSGKLSSRDSVELSSRIAELTGAKLPLAPGLRAAAAELPDGRLAAAMKRVAAAVESGQSLEQALSAESGRLPSDLGALVSAGVRTGDLGRVLSDYVRLRRELDDVRRKLWLAIAYPGFLVLAAAALGIFFFAIVIPAMASLVRTINKHEFVTSPAIPTTLQTAVDASEWVARNSAAILVGAGVVVAMVLLGAVIVGPRWRRKVVKSLPLFGALWRYSGLIEAAELLRMLLENDVPLPESLRLTADGIRDADLADSLRHVAERVAAGNPLSVALQSSSQFPPFWEPVLAWGEAHSSLPAALETVRRATMRRLDQRMDLIAAIVPPAVFLSVIALVLFAMSFVGQVFRFIFGWLMFTSSRSSSSAPPPEWPAPSLSGAANLLIVGCAILVAIRVVYPERRTRADGLEIVMRLGGWLLTALGVLGILTVFADGWAWLVWIAALACWGMAVFQFRESQRWALLDLIALSAEGRMPLAPAVRAMADDEGGLFATRAAPLADALESGTSLARAIERNRRALPPASHLAAKVGEVTGGLGAALASIDARRGRAGTTGGDPPIRVMSLVYTLIVAGFVAPFMAIKIAPAMQKIFTDFRRPLPPLTTYLFHAAGSLWLAVFSSLMLVVALATGFYATIRGLGWMRFELPPASWLFAPRESAVVLRLLALAVERGRAIGPLLEFLAAEYPSALIRNRARVAALDIARGGDWVASLRAAKLVRRTDAAILAAAARAGNVPWALREAASNAERRLRYRMSIVARVTLPLLILAAGFAVMVFVVGYFLPLVDLIGGLAKPDGR